MTVAGRFLGARFSPDSTAIDFRAAAPRAQRVELSIFPAATDMPAALSLVMTASSARIFSATVTITSLRAARVIGAVYYGYRVWGPNWPYVAGRSPGSNAGFIADVDVNGNRFNPSKLPAAKTARRCAQGGGSADGRV